MAGLTMTCNPDNWSCLKDRTRKIGCITFPCPDFKRRPNIVAINNHIPPQVGNASTDKDENCEKCEYSFLNVG